MPLKQNPGWCTQGQYSPVGATNRERRPCGNFHGHSFPDFALGFRFGKADGPRVDAVAQPGNHFAQLTTLVRAGLGGPFGSGWQTVSWIHAQDYARAIDFLIARNDLDGPFNLAAPEPLAQRDFMAVLRDVWDRPNGLPWPTPLIHLLSLLRADAALALHSCHALPGHLTRAGFKFDFPDWPSACADLARQWRALEL